MAIALHLSPTFLADLEKLEPQKRVKVIDALDALPAAFGDPHRHSGLGLRKIHSSGVWELRAGLKLRVVFLFSSNAIVAEVVGDHKRVQSYLRRL